MGDEGKLLVTYGRLATMLLTAGATILGIDTVYDKCIKTKL